MFNQMSCKKIFLIVLIIHLMSLGLPLRSRVLKRIEKEVIKIQLILPDKNLTVVNVPSDEEALDAIPDNARFLSDKNQKVMEETIAKPKKKNGDLTLGELSKEALSEIDPNSMRMKQEVGGKNLSDQKSYSLEYVSGDFLENVQESDKTSINTIQFKYYSFYKRIKDQVEGQWNVLLNNHLPSDLKLNRNVETIALIKIDRTGRIIGAKIEQDSGLTFLDKIVVVTFDKIEFFQNPPQELFKDREFMYIQWGFRVGL